MPVKHCLLQGRDLTSMDRFYDELARQLDFPSWFGRNLDALWDLLTTDIPGPITIRIKQPRTAERLLGEAYSRILDLFKEVEEERDDFKVVVR
ncbi:MAG TPA: barstar family protein [bacterium]|nr:barstar family protein [bacterium]HQG46935.1 barstar family protein [bacterium]HQI49426.1 barstar family protein [bacterium]HQJ65291.1 barstar family protein [bacterium]